MKRLFNIVLFFVLILLVGCEKSLVSEDTPEGGSTPAITPDIKAGALSIGEAIMAEDGTQICVKGFLVGATKLSINNTEFAPSFNKEYTTAIVLANRQADGTEEAFGEGVDIFPVCLTDAAKGIRDAYNLPNHENYWNQFVYISGTKETYMSLDGMKKVKAIEVDFNHVVTDEEKPESGNDNEDDNPNEDENDNTGGGTNNEGDNEGTTESDTPSSDVLTVAEAKNAAEHSHITVKGYIVAALSGGTEYISFDYPNFNGYKTAIVLADSKYTAENSYDTTNYRDLLIIYLGDCKPSSLKDKLNLVKHPENQNKFVSIEGTIGFYYGTNVLLEVSDYDWLTP